MSNAIITGYNDSSGKSNTSLRTFNETFPYINFGTATSQRDWNFFLSPTIYSIYSLTLTPTPLNYVQKTGELTLRLDASSSLTPTDVSNNFQINPPTAGTISNVSTTDNITYTALFTATNNTNTSCTITASGDIYNYSFITSPFSINTVIPSLVITPPNLTYLNPIGQLRLTFASELLTDLSLSNFSSSDLSFSDFTKTNTTTYDFSVNLSTEFTGTKRIVYSYYDTSQNIDISCNTFKPRIASSIPLSNPLLTYALRNNTIQIHLTRNIIGDLDSSYFTNFDRHCSNNKFHNSK